MKLTDRLSNIPWETVQNLHNEGLAYSKIANSYINDEFLSRKLLELAIKEGLFVKNRYIKNWTDKDRKESSEKRKAWLKNNPEKHPWRKSDKFRSVPCELLKEKLRESNISFFEEVLVSEEINYSVDILIPSKNLVIEVNGNQHYNPDGTLKEYYQNRHDFIKSLGWEILELHYSLVYDPNILQKLISETPSECINLPFYIREKKQDNRKYGDFSKYKEYLRSSEHKENVLQKWRLENEKYISLVLSSGIDFSKNGWVKLVSNIINQKTQKVNIWMKRMMPDFYEEKCYKRKKLPSRS